MTSSYADLLAEHAQLPSFEPAVPTSALSPLALVCLPMAFVLSFYFTTLRSKPAQELAVGAAASLLGGIGLVCAFCALGINV
ncbi:hypothetical protein ACM66B_004441 [Microbotryomycetes sp. NB124-2]